MSQQDFAKIINSNQTEVSFIERGFIPEDAKKIQAIQIIYDLNCEKN
jgi:transcriptional regulator with XRE-family HTH domain